ncbi:class I SAM-dependent methyltransferase [Methylocystis heyeri]|uniref:Methyltransferase domain-containing protein n=1 Tax=Methylocystis heyeri TaxID=391905 RepID=A0A6B8KC32_9HYPH|nr:class I SAM-dependent methyltransferase [Methylocystis heyeri]QGM45249.1 methyltransferase domain-containing protein [Methylocystis heyeri]
MQSPGSNSNLDAATVASFGDEWSRYDQSDLGDAERALLFERYFRIFPWNSLPPMAEGFDMGCGSGRWAELVSPRVGLLNCIDPSSEALAVARRNLAGSENVRFTQASADAVPIEESSQDFGYSLGVLHHIPDTQAAMGACVRLLKPGAPFLVYLYYRFDNRPAWFRALWRLSEILRGCISALPPRLKHLVTDLIAFALYWPLARMARLGELLGWDMRHWPLYGYRGLSFYTMRTDARDRFGTPLEQRFTREEIGGMMRAAGLKNIIFSDSEPFWCAVGEKC